MKNSIIINREIWNEKHDWKKNGDEWDGQARKCKVDYDYYVWFKKASIIKKNMAKAMNITNINCSDLKVGAIINQVVTGL